MEKYCNNGGKRKKFFRENRVTCSPDISTIGRAIANISSLSCLQIPNISALHSQPPPINIFNNLWRPLKRELWLEIWINKLKPVNQTLSFSCSCSVGFTICLHKPPLMVAPWIWIWHFELSNFGGGCVYLNIILVLMGFKYWLWLYWFGLINK